MRLAKDWNPQGALEVVSEAEVGQRVVAVVNTLHFTPVLGCV